jgi:MYXO-CTERM domain-containing protein
VAGAALFAASRSADAHIRLLFPTDWLNDDGTGTAQKTGPCGDPLGEWPALTMTGKVTALKAGDSIMVSWMEMVQHGGWFRIVIAKDRMDPALKDPMVTAGQGTSSPTVTTVKPEGEMVPVGGALVWDGLFHHPQGGAGKMWQYKLTVPNMACDQCVMQVIQFMTPHPPNYFYHHCADISISAGTGEVDAGIPPPPDGGADTSAADSGGASGSGSGGAIAGEGGASAGEGGATGKGGTTASGAGGRTSGKGGTSGQGGSSGGDNGEGGDDTTPAPESKSGCSVGHAPAPTALASPLVLATIILVRRRRR